MTDYSRKPNETGIGGESADSAPSHEAIEASQSQNPSSMTINQCAQSCIDSALCQFGQQPMHLSRPKRC